MKDMKRFIATTIVAAKPMTLGEYNELRGWTIPEDEDPATMGFYVEHENDHKTWVPDTAFSNFRPLDGGIPFSAALEGVLHKGARAARKGWNGKKMFIFLVPGSTFEVSREPLLSILGEGTKVNYHGHIDMKTADGTIVPWLCSQTDMQAEDWTFV